MTNLVHGRSTAHWQMASNQNSAHQAPSSRRHSSSVSQPSFDRCPRARHEVEVGRIRALGWTRTSPSTRRPGTQGARCPWRPRSLGPTQPLSTHAPALQVSKPPQSASRVRPARHRPLWRDCESAHAGRRPRRTPHSDPPRDHRGSRTGGTAPNGVALVLSALHASAQSGSLLPRQQSAAA